MQYRPMLLAAVDIHGCISFNPIQYGVFLKHYGMGGHYGPPCNFAVS